jgi:hypothetical protein
VVGSQQGLSHPVRGNSEGTGGKPLEKTYVVHGNLLSQMGRVNQLN